MIEKILNPETEFGDVFPNDLTKSKDIYRGLCKQLHPDRCSDPRATKAFQRLKELYDEATREIEAGTWHNSHCVLFARVGGKKIQIRPQFRCTFELGEYFVTNTHIVYSFDKSKEKFYKNFAKQLKTLRYADSKMEKMFKPLFPQVYEEFDTMDDKHIIVLNKTEDVYPLRCVIENFYQLKVPATHMAWMISRLMNICCYLKHNETVVNGINLDNCFISLEYHTILLEGGWWYSTKANDPMIGTTREILGIMPPKVKADKVSSFITDVESVKAFGRKYIADDAPQTILDFLNSGTSEDSFAEMEKWDTALTTAFGKRHFIKIEATKNEIYKK